MKNWKKQKGFSICTLLLVIVAILFGMVQYKTAVTPAKKVADTSTSEKDYVEKMKEKEVIMNTEKVKQK